MENTKQAITYIQVAVAQQTFSHVPNLDFPPRHLKKALDVDSQTSDFITVLVNSSESSKTCITRLHKVSLPPSSSSYESLVLFFFGIVFHDLRRNVDSVSILLPRYVPSHILSSSGYYYHISYHTRIRNPCQAA